MRVHQQPHSSDPTPSSLLETKKKASSSTVSAPSSDKIAEKKANKIQNLGEGVVKKAEISHKSQELSHAKKIAEGAPDVREERVMELKQKIDSGTYSVSPEQVADRLVDEHIQTLH